ncbi:MAG TPA: hypothetical protein PKA38_05260 [Candidatus Levybacteria bacterium]|nr:hypothetical protein [Candidatus Levybacteria bacterium]
MANAKEIGRNVALRTSLAASVVVGSAAGLHDSPSIYASNETPNLSYKVITPEISYDPKKTEDGSIQLPFTEVISGLYFNNFGDKQVKLIDNKKDWEKIWKNSVYTGPDNWNAPEIAETDNVLIVAQGAGKKEGRMVKVSQLNDKGNVIEAEVTSYNPDILCKPKISENVQNPMTAIKFSNPEKKPVRVTFNQVSNSLYSIANVSNASAIIKETGNGEFEITGTTFSQAIVLIEPAEVVDCTDLEPLKVGMESPVNNASFTDKDIIVINAQTIDKDDASQLDILVNGKSIPNDAIKDMNCVSGVAKDEKTEEKMYAGVACEVKIDASKLPEGVHEIEARGSEETSHGGSKIGNIMRSSYAYITKTK